MDLEGKLMLVQKYEIYAVFHNMYFPWSFEDFLCLWNFLIKIYACFIFKHVAKLILWKN